MKAQGTVVAIPQFNPELVRSQPRNGPFFEFGRRGNKTGGDGDSESRHLIQPSLMLSRHFVQPLAGLRRGQE